MNIKNYLEYGRCIYENVLSDKDDFKLGDVVINCEKKIGVIIQIHSPCEFRTDMFGNVSSNEIRISNDVEITINRPNLFKQNNFKHQN